MRTRLMAAPDHLDNHMPTEAAPAPVMSDHEVMQVHTFIALARQNGVRHQPVFVPCGERKHPLAGKIAQKMLPLPILARNVGADRKQSVEAHFGRRC